MSQSIASPIKKRQRQNHVEERPKPNPLPFLIFLLLIIGVVFALSRIVAGDREQPSPIVVDEEGNVSFSPERQEKMNKELEEIDDAQQYALLASEDGNFPCYTCPNGIATIFLRKGEVWKYGVTRLGVKRRYPGNNFGVSNVFYVAQFRGNYAECLKMEKVKIYNYPLLPEARMRTVLLARPPGNANDG